MLGKSETTPLIASENKGCGTKLGESITKLGESCRDMPKDRIFGYSLFNGIASVLYLGTPLALAGKIPAVAAVWGCIPGVGTTTALGIGAIKSYYFFKRYCSSPKTHPANSTPAQISVVVDQPSAPPLQSTTSQPVLRT